MMGMVLYGVKNKDAYFRANVWSWRPINGLMRMLNLIDEDLYTRMSYNDGKGPDEKQCRLIARGLRNWLDNHPNIATFGVTPKHTDTEQIVMESLGAECASSYNVSRDHLEKFVAFLSTCGGFQVW
jgi:hypothetical protein